MGWLPVGARQGVSRSLPGLSSSLYIGSALLSVPIEQTFGLLIEDQSMGHCAQAEMADSSRKT